MGLGQSQQVGLVFVPCFPPNNALGIFASLSTFCRTPIARTSILLYMGKMDLLKLDFTTWRPTSPRHSSRDASTWAFPLRTTLIPQLAPWVLVE